ncbi:MAG TPA: sugar MFS transporter [Steroidobacteraceae bacterium]|nr:sugar MFS transporter [Steroidobacteraceae bacterium]
MQIDSSVTSSTDPVPDTDPASHGVNAPDLRLFVFALFFIFGGITSLNDILIPKLKSLFTLDHAQALLVQSAFFAAYFVISLPATAVVQRFGYMRTAALGLVTMTVGCLLFVPASASASFAVFLFALFVLAAGITTVQVVANPLISLLGAPRTAHSRLTFAQAFNSLGTTVFPYVGSALFLAALPTVDPATLSGAALDSFRATQSKIVVYTYLGLAVALTVIAIAVWLRRHRLAETPSGQGSVLRAFQLLARPRFGFGALCIFLYVGAEVAIGSLIVFYLERADVLGLGAEAAGKHVPYYWGGALVGRFIGSALLRLYSPGKVLACAAAGSILLLAISTHSTGAVAGWTLLAIGLCNSIMFPTIFSLASEGLGRRAAEGSGVICVAIVGGAIVPPLTGLLADDWGLRNALALPALCYAVILAFGIYARRPAL